MDSLSGESDRSGGGRQRTPHVGSGSDFYSDIEVDDDDDDDDGGGGGSIERMAMAGGNRSRSPLGPACGRQ